MGNLGRDWDATNIELVIYVLTKFDRVQELIQLMSDGDVATRAKAFPFTYDVRETAGVRGGYPDCRIPTAFAELQGNEEG